MTEHLSLVVEGYDDFLRDLKERIRSAHVKAALAVSHELVTLGTSAVSSLPSRCAATGELRSSTVWR